MDNRSGKLKTNLSGPAAYKSFSPNPLPPHPPITLDDELITILVNANKKITTLESLATHIPNVELFISMYVRKEALMSSQIEGTQATLEDVLDPLLDENTNRNVADVINYIQATEYAINRLKDFPLCNRLLRETHNILMQDVRGQEKNPGEFRYSQNWIGGQGSSLKNARYIPPNPEDMIEAMSDLEKYLNNDEDELNPLIRAALIHYQFETIHPFLDGNGRIGRLLITLFLMDQKVLTTPALYISYFLKNRIEYYDRMTEVRNKGTYEQWILFFLQAILESAEDAISTINELILLHNQNIEHISKLGRASKNTLKVFHYLESNPIIEISKTSLDLALAFNTTSSAINRLLDIGILVQIDKTSRKRTFAYDNYLQILRKGT